MKTMMLKDVLELTDDIGLNDYPLFNGVHRQPLNDKIIKHYFMREIGYETIDLFRWGMSRKMGEVMPAFNKLYEAQLKVSPFESVNLTQTSSAENTGTTRNESESSNTTSSDSRATNFDMPSEQLRNDGNYASSGTDAKSSGDSESTAQDVGSTQSVAQSTSHTSGFTGDRVDVYSRYAQSIEIFNIDMLVINSLATEFMSVFSDNSTYNPRMSNWWFFR